jgi:pyruvate/2-oxoglutarate dehydrogenase complex dihydrolipoamide acyltransferase (E2) component
MNKMDLLGHYKIEKFPVERLRTLDSLAAGTNKSVVYGLLDFDVTLARQRLRDYRRSSGHSVSFLAWFVKCVAQAVSEHPEVQIYRHGRSKIVTFADVDVVVIVERFKTEQSTNFPTTLRRANLQSLEEIDSVIRTAKNLALSEKTVVLGESHPVLEHLAKWAPGFVHRWWWRHAKSDAFLTKKVMGTVAITSLGMFGNTTGYILPSSVHNLCFGLGSLNRQPAVVNGKIEIRQILKVTICANHETVDGAPLARFIARLNDLLQSAWSLI